jgi:hypothetical protein
VPVAVTTDALLTRIKARAQVPATEGRLSDAEILTLVDDLIVSSVGREAYDADDGRWIKTAADVALTASLATYRLPTRALGGGIDEVILVDSAGNLAQLDYVDRADIWEYGTSTGVPVAYALLGDVLQLLPAPSSSSYSVRVRYVRRPSQLVLVAACGGVNATPSGAAVLVADSPASWASDSFEVDVIEATHHGEALEDEVTGSFNAGPTTFTRTSGTWATTGAYAVLGPDSQRYRAYMCESGESCIVQVPDIAIPYIADLAARDVCVALGDMEGADRSASIAEQRRREMSAVISERSRTRPKIVPRNSPLRVAGMRAARWFR